MEVIGKIIVALPAVSGTSAAGKAWNKREYVLETEDTYPKKVFFDFFGEKADQYPLAVGDKVRLSFACCRCAAHSRECHNNFAYYFHNFILLFLICFN